MYKKVYIQRLYFYFQEKDDTENLNDDYNWKENLEKNIRKLKCSSTSQRNILKAINGIRNRLVMAVTYNSEEKSLNHITLFQQRPSENSLDQVINVKCN